MHKYITIIEIGGAHAHRLRPLLERIGIPTLIITDIDPCHNENNKTSVYKPELGKNYISDNYTLTNWILGTNSYDILIQALDTNKEKGNIRVAYQTYVEIKGERFYPYTFEDCFIYENIAQCENKFDNITRNNCIIQSVKKCVEDKKYYNIKSSLSKMSKAEFALDVLYEIDDFIVPEYIKEGLSWLSKKI